MASCVLCHSYRMSDEMESDEDIHTETEEWFFRYTSLSYF